jgi:hypothetical protein
MAITRCAKGSSASNKPSYAMGLNKVTKIGVLKARGFVPSDKDPTIYEKSMPAGCGSKTIQISITASQWLDKHKMEKAVDLLIEEAGKTKF